MIVVALLSAAGVVIASRTARLAAASDGSPLDPDDISGQFEDLMIAAGLPSIPLHDVRHGAATLLLASGADTKEVQETLGRADTAKTANTHTSIFRAVGRCPLRLR